MSDVASLRQEALELLNQQLIPGVQGNKLHASVQRLGRILEELERRGGGAQPVKKTIEQRVQTIENRIAMLLMNPEGMAKQPGFVKPGLEALLYDLETLHKPTHNAYLIPQAQHATQLREAPSIKHFTHIPYAYLEGTPSESVKTLQALSITPELAKHYRVHPLRAQQELWNLTLIGQPELAPGLDGSGIRIGVADTGIDYTHNALQARFEDNKGYDFVTDTNDPMDENGHGTHVAGTIAGTDIGVAQGATLYALRFLDANGYGSEIGFIKAAEWAIDHGLHILNGSFGSGSPSNAEKAVCDALAQHGILFAAAAGNDGTADYHYPASYDSVLSVAAINQHKERAGFSQYNDQVSIAAPGVDIHSSVPGGYAEYSGTSMATPHVAGSLAVIRALHDDAAYARELLQTSAEQLGPAEEYGSGLVRVDQATRIDAFRKRWAA